MGEEKQQKDSLRKLILSDKSENERNSENYR